MAAQNYKSQLKGINGSNFKTFWKSLGEKSDNCIRVFLQDNLGHFTLHDSDTKCIKEILNIENVTNATEREVNTTSMDWAMINLVQLRQLLKELIIVKGFRVEIYTKSESGEWEGVFGSPGNLSCIEEYVFDPTGSDNSVPTCRVLSMYNLKQSADQNKYVIGIVDAENREALVATIDDDNRYSQLESILVQIQVKELITSSKPNDRLKDTLSRCSTLITIIHKNKFEIPSSDNSIFAKGCGTENENHLQCISAGVKYLDLGHNCQLKCHELEMSRYARLDSSIFDNLHLCSAKETSIFSILSAGCVTTQGARLVRKWITQPLVRQEEISERLDIVEVLIEENELRNRLSNVELKKLPDISKMALKIAQFARADAKFTMKVVLNTLVRINHVCKRLPILIELLSPIENVHVQSALVQPTLMLDGKIQKLVMLIDTHVENGQSIRIKPGIDEELDQIRESLDELREQMEELIETVSQDLDIPRKEIKLDETNDGMAFRVTNRHDKILNKNKQYQRLGTTKTAITFTSPSLQRYSDKWAEKMEEYEAHAKVIIQKMVSIVFGYTKYLVQVGEVSAMLDAFLGFANAAVSMSEPWTKPEFTKERKIQIKDLRHPILEYKNIDVVANDVEMSDSQRFMVLTGPNMGGKSTYLRATAICGLLAQIGSFVPASKAILPIFDAMIARIGAGDNIQRGISTFLHEMIETETIFRTATEKSFVVVDELGRGTSTWDGFGLAFAISTSLVQDVKCFGMFATHYHEMASLPSKCPAAFNMHTSVFVNESKVTHLFKIEEGSCSKSYGIDIAKLVGFNENVLKRASDLNLEMEKIDQITARELNVDKRNEAVSVLKELIQKCKSDPSNVKRDEILEFIKKQNNPILNAVITV